MKIFYCCYGGAHSSVVATAIHLHQLPMVPRPAIRAILALPLFNQANSNQIGTPVFAGIDTNGNTVYVVGLSQAIELAERAARDLLQCYGVSVQDLLLVWVHPTTSTLTKIGGIMAKRLGLGFVGRPLTALGIWLRYSRYVALVKHTQQQIKGSG